MEDNCFTFLFCIGIFCICAFSFLPDTHANCIAKASSSSRGNVKVTATDLFTDTDRKYGEDFTVVSDEQ